MGPRSRSIAKGKNVKGEEDLEQREIKKKRRLKWGGTPKKLRENESGIGLGNSGWKESEIGWD